MVSQISLNLSSTPQIGLDVSIYRPSPGCFNWCKESNFIHASNIETNMFILLGFTAMLLLIWDAYPLYSRFIEPQHKDKIEKVIMMLPALATYLILGVIAWFLFIV